MFPSKGCSQPTLFFAYAIWRSEYDVKMQFYVSCMNNSGDDFCQSVAFCESPRRELHERNPPKCVISVIIVKSAATPVTAPPPPPPWDEL